MWETEVILELTQSCGIYKWSKWLQRFQDHKVKEWRAQQKHKSRLCLNSSLLPLWKNITYTKAVFKMPALPTERWGKHSLSCSADLPCTELSCCLTKSDQWASESCRWDLDGASPSQIPVHVSVNTSWCRRNRNKEDWCADPRCPEKLNYMFSFPRGIGHSN